MTRERFNQLRDDGITMWKWLSVNVYSDKLAYLHYLTNHDPVRRIRTNKYMNVCPFCHIYGRARCSECPLKSCYSEHNVFKIWRQNKPDLLDNNPSIFEKRRRYAALYIMRKFENWKYEDLPERSRK